jgi:hypothetical protein
MSHRKSALVDIHTKNAISVASHEYFVVNRTSDNENPGLLVGTAVKKVSEIEHRDSRYWKNKTYWSVIVECPNGEKRRIGCDALTVDENDQRFLFQQEMFVE